MTRELPLVIGSIVTVLLAAALLPVGILFFVGNYDCAYGRWYCLEWQITPVRVILEIAWLSMFGLALLGIITVRKHRKIGGLSFIIAGFMPGVSILILSALFSNVPNLAWLPLYTSLGSLLGYPSLVFAPAWLLIAAGVMAIANLPRPYMERDPLILHQEAQMRSLNSPTSEEE